MRPARGASSHCKPIGLDMHATYRPGACSARPIGVPIVLYPVAFQFLQDAPARGASMHPIPCPSCHRYRRFPAVPGACKVYRINPINSISSNPNQSQSNPLNPSISLQPTQYPFHLDFCGRIFRSSANPWKAAWRAFCARLCLVPDGLSLVFGLFSLFCKKWAGSDLEVIRPRYFHFLGRLALC